MKEALLLLLFTRLNRVRNVFPQLTTLRILFHVQGNIILKDVQKLQSGAKNATLLDVSVNRFIVSSILSGVTAR